MSYRRPRIAISVFFGLVAIAFALLWVRSFWHRDDFRCMIGSSVFNMQSLRGEIGIGSWAWRFKPIEWKVSSMPVDSPDRLWPPVKDQLPLSAIGMRWARMGPDMTLISIRSLVVSLFALLLAALPSIPWFRTRYSLRTLLIATTLVAVVLGFAVWTGR